MTIPHNDSPASQGLPDLYAGEKIATAIAISELINTGEFELANYIVESTDPGTLLEGFTNVIAIAVQLISSLSGVDEKDVHGMLRATSYLIENGGSTNLDEVPATL